MLFISRNVIKANIFLFFFLTCFVYASEVQVKHILSHERFKVVTDPSKGVNTYPQWTVFPPKSTEYRKVTLYVTYRCPDGLHCGEWDYIDAVNLRRVGGVQGEVKGYELARIISPYGWQFDSTWHFTWHVDITDFAFLLHDSVEIEFYHSGYEANTDRGWLVTVDFAITEGKPAMQYLAVDTLWNGQFMYGDSTKSIENYLYPRIFTNTHNADIARVRIVQTGHGMDDFENCAEFCYKKRLMLFDDTLMGEKLIWRECGTNPLYPQGGTWIYDRANWCPGSVVFPDVYDHPIAPNSTHSVNIEMQPYVNPNKPTANYFIRSYLFYCTKPWAVNDVSLEEIITPNTIDEYSRMNPICSSPGIVVKNSGGDTLRSLTIKYGIEGEKTQTYQWKGILESQKSQQLELPGVLSGNDGKHRFTVKLDLPNGQKDEYPDDNTLSTEVTVPPVYNSDMILVMRINNDSFQDSYTLTDGSGTVVKERKLGTMLKNTTYRDTISLKSGCYQLLFSDTAGDGLDFWANPDGGYGYVRLLDIKGRLIKSFRSDFGAEVRHSFTVRKGTKYLAPSGELPLVNPFPIRNPGKFTLELFCNAPEDVQIVITTEDGSRTVFETTYTNMKEDTLPIDISKEPDGFYFIKVTVDKKTVTKKIKVKHQG